MLANYGLSSLFSKLCYNNFALENGTYDFSICKTYLIEGDI